MDEGEEEGHEGELEGEGPDQDEGLEPDMVLQCTSMV